VFASRPGHYSGVEFRATFRLTFPRHEF
jgi:hypothetical protein